MEIQKLYEWIRIVKKEISKLIEKSDKNIVILIAWGSASGKTSLIAKRILNKYKNKAILLSMDNYYIWADYVKKNNITFDEPKALDLELFKSDLSKLKSWKIIHSPIYDFKKWERTDDFEKIKPNKIIIVEWLFALEENIAQLWDYKIFVDLWTHWRVLRRIFRDIDRTWDSAENILKYFSQVVEPKNTEYIEPTKENADIIIENKYIPFIESRNSKIKETQIKYKINCLDFDNIAQYINKLWWFYVWELIETDYFLSKKWESLKLSDEIMRIRNVWFWKYLLSYRWPKVKNKNYEKRYWINFFIDFEILEAFKNIYWDFKQVLTKKRQNYFLNWMIVSLDLFENWEKYIDFRFEEWKKANNEMEEFLNILELDTKKWIKKSYFEIIK